jgi:uncharacterized protein (TIGR02996 family)
MKVASEEKGMSGGTAVNADEARLQAQLDQHPDDRTSRQVLADLLEEQGEEAAARFQRWLAAQGLWPDNDLPNPKQTGWHWWSAVSELQRERSHAVVPAEVQQYMPIGEWIYPSRAAAEAALAQALGQVPGGME